MTTDTHSSGACSPRQQIHAGAARSHPPSLVPFCQWPYQSAAAPPQCAPFAHPQPVHVHACTPHATQPYTRTVVHQHNCSKANMHHRCACQSSTPVGNLPSHTPQRCLAATLQHCKHSLLQSFTAIAHVIAAHTFWRSVIAKASALFCSVKLSTGSASARLTTKPVTRGSTTSCTA
eukprot:1150229-Pelagomonas_calceolata.AAC.6